MATSHIPSRNRIRETAARSAGLREIPSVAPRAWHYALLAILATAGAIYGSLIPLEFTPVEWDVAVERFRSMPFRPMAIGARADWVANILLFLPLGFLWMGALTVDRTSLPVRLLAAAFVIAMSTGLSALIEFAQIWFPPRTVGLNDVVAETIGGAVGAVLWLVLGPRVTLALRTYLADTRPRRQFDRLVQFYVLGLAIYSLLPLDLTIHPGEIYQKFREGKVELIPFSRGAFSAGTLWHSVVNAVIFAPVGAWCATVLTREERPVRGAAVSTLLAACVAAGFEIAQLFVYSRFTSTTEVLTATVGGLAGALLVARFNGDSEARHSAVDHNYLHKALAAVAVLGYSLLLCIVFWWPLEPLRKGPEVRARVDGFLALPFRRLQRSSDFNFVNEIIRKSLLFAVLGGLLSPSVRSLTASRALRRVLYGLACVWCVALGTGIEMGQAAFPPHVPDVTDVLLYTFGGLAGMFMVARLAGARVVRPA
jgi:VanZ family protein